MNPLSYPHYDATALSELIRKKEVSAVEVVEAAIARLERLNPELNAVIHKMYEKARSAAKEITMQGTFAGIPVLLKDIGQEIGGEPCTQGAKALRDYRAAEDSTYTKRMRAAGVIILGRTNVPEFGLMGITEPELYGPTRNPWNTGYTPGGSSGGSAAAVASGMVPLAGASDGGGSIRIPASYCGLFGLKPSRGRNPAGPFVGRSWEGASVAHVLTRSVRDSASMLDQLKGYEAGTAFAPPPFDHNYLECVLQGPQHKMKIAFTADSPFGTAVHPECRKAVTRAAELLESLGHRVEERKLPLDGNKIAQSYMTLYFGDTAATIALLERVLGRKARMNDMELATWMLGLVGKVVSSEEWVLGLNEWDAAAYRMETFFKDYDLFMTPTAADLQSKIGEQVLSGSEAVLMKMVYHLKLVKTLKKLGFVESLIKRSLQRTPFTQLANLTGQPAMSVPLHLSPEGLPLGVQFIAAKGREDKLYRLAGRLEQTEQWIRVEDNPIYKT